MPVARHELMTVCSSLRPKASDGAATLGFGVCFTQDFGPPQRPRRCRPNLRIPPANLRAHPPRTRALGTCAFTLPGPREETGFALGEPPDLRKIPAGLSRLPRQRERPPVQALACPLTDNAMPGKSPPQRRLADIPQPRMFSLCFIHLLPCSRPRDNCGFPQARPASAPDKHVAPATQAVPKACAFAPATTICRIARPCAPRQRGHGSCCPRVRGRSSPTNPRANQWPM